MWRHQLNNVRPTCSLAVPKSALRASLDTYVRGCATTADADVDTAASAAAAAAATTAWRRERLVVDVVRPEELGRWGAAGRAAAALRCSAGPLQAAWPCARAFRSIVAVVLLRWAGCLLGLGGWMNWGGRTLVVCGGEVDKDCFKGLHS